MVGVARNLKLRRGHVLRPGDLLGSCCRIQVEDELRRGDGEEGMAPVEFRGKKMRQLRIELKLQRKWFG